MFLLLQTQCRQRFKGCNINFFTAPAHIIKLDFSDIDSRFVNDLLT